MIACERHRINECKEDRVVLIVDVLRPMPWLPQLLNRLTFRVIFSRLFTGKAVANIKDTVARMGYDSDGMSKSVTRNGAGPVRA